ncbi:MAG TPA: acylphosphatase [Aestuariivirgaceae bacterium]|jgi:acylphosphatase
MVNNTVTATIRGRVQGVGYRDWAERQAKALGLSGYVRNKRDGSVELVLSGAKERVERMLSLCREGPRLAQVADMDVAVSTWSGSGFEVLPTL